MADEVRFEDPPVREVALAVLFEPMAAASVLDLASFRLELASDYPHAEELAPLAPWEGVDEEWASFVAGQSKWPMPLCVLANATRDMQIVFQNDRLALSWTYGLDAPTYPGFSVLYAEMERAYRGFLNSIHNSSNPLPVIKRISIRYTNQISGVSAGALASGLLHGWPISDRQSEAEQWTTTSLRLHRHSTETEDIVSLLVLIDPDEPDDPDAPQDSQETNDARSSILRIGADIDIEGQEDTLPALERAHEVVLSKFLGFTSEEMAQKWGRIK